MIPKAQNVSLWLGWSSYLLPLCKGLFSCPSFIKASRCDTHSLWIPSNNFADSLCYGLCTNVPQQYYDGNVNCEKYDGLKIMPKSKLLQEDIFSTLSKDAPHVYDPRGLNHWVGLVRTAGVWTWADGSSLMGSGWTNWYRDTEPQPPNDCVFIKVDDDEVNDEKGLAIRSHNVSFGEWQGAECQSSSDGGGTSTKARIVCQYGKVPVEGVGLSQGSRFNLTAMPSPRLRAAEGDSQEEEDGTDWVTIIFIIVFIAIILLACLYFYYLWDKKKKRDAQAEVERQEREDAEKQEKAAQKERRKSQRNKSKGDVKGDDAKPKEPTTVAEPPTEPADVVTSIIEKMISVKVKNTRDLPAIEEDSDKEAEEEEENSSYYYDDGTTSSDVDTPQYSDVDLREEPGDQPVVKVKEVEDLGFSVADYDRARDGDLLARDVMVVRFTEENRSSRKGSSKGSSRKGSKRRSPSGKGSVKGGSSSQKGSSVSRKESEGDFPSSKKGTSKGVSPQ